MRPYRRRKIEFAKRILNFDLITAMPSPQSPFSAHAVHRRRRRRHAGTATGCPTRRAPDQTRFRAPGLARNRSPWHPTALATRPGTLCSPRRRGWPATRRSTRALRPRPAQRLLGLLASPSHSPPLPRHGNPAPAPSCLRASSPSRPWRSLSTHFIIQLGEVLVISSG